MSQLESQLDVCPLLKQCNPDDDEIENYCCLNYENCEKYIQTQINKYNLKVGDVLKLKEPLLSLTEITISLIHPTGGWVLFKETNQIPQEVEKILSLIKLDCLVTKDWRKYEINS